MTLVYADRVQETSTTTGVGTYTLAGAVTGYQAFGAVCANTDTVYYCATDGIDWEVGLGTWATGGTLARTSVQKSSNSNNAVNWGAGTRNIFLDIPAYFFTTAAAFGGTVAASNLSGTNTGDQTSVSGNAGTATALATARAIYGNNFDGSASLTQIIASTFGGTGNGFTKFTGPATSEKTFTLPNADSTIVVQGGALGTPSSGTLTSATGLPISTGVSGLGSNVATFLATPSSANLRAALTDENGTGAALFDSSTSANFITPVLGVATGTSLALSGVASVGANSGTNGQITFSGSTSGSVAVKVAAAAGTGTVFQLPADNGTNTYVLQTNGSGVTSWASPGAATLTVGSSAIASGTTTRVLYDNAGTLGEYVISGSGNVAMTTSPSFTTPTLGVASATSLAVTGAVAAGESVFDVTANTAIGFGVNGAQVAQIDVNGIPKFTSSSRVTSNVSKTSSTTLGSVTGLTATLAASKNYAFRVVLYTTEGASGGLRVSMGGGSSSLTSGGVIIWAAHTIYFYGAGLAGSTPFNTTLAANVDCGVGPLQVMAVLEGNISVGSTGGGTLIPQFAQSASNGTATTVLVGSNMKVWEIT